MYFFFKDLAAVDPPMAILQIDTLLPGDTYMYKLDKWIDSDLDEYFCCLLQTMPCFICMVINIQMDAM